MSNSDEVMQAVMQACQHGNLHSCIWCCRDDNARLESDLSTVTAERDRLNEQVNRLSLEISRLNGELSERDRLQEAISWPCHKLLTVEARAILEGKE